VPTSAIIPTYPHFVQTALTVRLPWKSKNNFSTPLGNPAEGAGFPLSHSPGGDDVCTAEQINGPDVVL
jgi:hypothetical protein